MDWPVRGALSDFRMIVSPYSILSVGGQAGGSFNVGSAAWVAANTAIFIPFRLSSAMLMKLLFVYNGSSVSGNIDVGIYAKDGTKLVSSGSTAQAGTSAFQTFDIADTLIGPGVFYLAAVMDNGTGHTTRLTPGVAIGRLLGAAQMATAFPLPATATLAALTASYWPLVGGTTRTFV
jgi:hypothetical protein